MKRRGRGEVDVMASVLVSRSASHRVATKSGGAVTKYKFCVFFTKRERGTRNDVSETTEKEIYAYMFRAGWARGRGRTSSGAGAIPRRVASSSAMRAMSRSSSDESKRDASFRSSWPSEPPQS